MTFTATTGAIETGVVVPEGSPFSCDIDFLDDDREAYAPNDVSMRVTDADGETIEDEASLSADSTMTISTEAATNNLSDDDRGFRIIVLKWTATTTLYPDGAPQCCNIHYSIQDLVGAS